MTPKEKAEDLINSYKIILMNEDTECGNEILCTSISKQCALIAVDEILKSKKQNIIHFYRCGDEFCECAGYWYEVKQEIELL